MTDANDTSVSFEATFGELVDVHLRWAEHSAVVRGWRRRSMFVTGSAAGVVSLAVLWPRPLPFVGAFPVAIGVGAAVGVAFRPWHRYWSTRRLERLIVEQYGRNAAVGCTVDLLSNGLRVCQSGTETTYAWAGAQILDEGTGDIELRFRQNLVVVRSRAFPNPVARARFLERARELARTCGGPGSQAA